MHNHATHNPKNDNNDGLTCPVMKGVPVDREEAERNGLVREYKGKKIYLCCESCLATFDQNPEAYV